MARDTGPERSGHFYIDETCIGCGACDHSCPGTPGGCSNVTTMAFRFSRVSPILSACGLCLALETPKVGSMPLGRST